MYLILQLWHIFVNQSGITLFLCYFYHVLWRFDTCHMVLSRHPAPNPIQSIRFSQIVPHFHSISTPYPFPYGFPLHWRALPITTNNPIIRQSINRGNSIKQQYRDFNEEGGVITRDYHVAVTSLVDSASVSVYPPPPKKKKKRASLLQSGRTECCLKVVCHLPTNSHDIFPRKGSHCFHLWTQPKCCPNLK